MIKSETILVKDILSIKVRVRSGLLHYGYVRLWVDWSLLVLGKRILIKPGRMSWGVWIWLVVRLENIIMKWLERCYRLVLAINLSVLWVSWCPIGIRD